MVCIEGETLLVYYSSNLNFLFKKKTSTPKNQVRDLFIR
jgi:hypothetical protein